jgi:RNA polymerase-binding transcription factor DksA
MAHKPARKPAPAAQKKAVPPAKAAKSDKSAQPAKPAKSTPPFKTAPVARPGKSAPPPPPAKSSKPSKPVAKKSAPKPMSKSKPSEKKPSAPAKPAPTPASAKTPAPASAKAPAPAKTPPAPKAAPAAAAKDKAKAPTPPAKPAAKTPPAAAPARPAAAKPLKGKEAVRAKILAQRAKPAKPSAFTLDEVLAIAKTAAAKTPATDAGAPKPVIATKSGKVAPLPAEALKPAAPTKVKAASLADILGFNPRAKASHAESEEDAIPEKFKRYYKLLVELRNHVTGQVDQHSEETLKRSAKEDSGDLSSYGTDGGTDSFDRDFALSLVANEQEALAEIEAAIQRIKAGSYGVCEHTEKPIPKERLLAVPFTRYTAEAMKEVEKTRYRVRGQAGIFGEGEEGGPKIEDGGDE